MARVVALDLGSHAVKATVYKGSGSRYQLEERYARSVPSSERSTLAQRVEVLGELLADEPSLRASGTVIGVTWPGELSSLHHIALPFTDKKQVEKTLPFAVESEVPFDLDEMVLGYRVLAQETKTEVLAALAHKGQVSELLDALSEVRVDPQRLNIDGEVLGAWGVKESEVMAIVDIGHHRTLVTIVSDGKVLWSHAIDVGGASFTAAIQRATGWSWEDAEKVKHGEARVAPEEETTDPGLGFDAYVALPAAPREAVDAAIGQLLAEVRTGLIAAEDELEVELESVALCGGGSRLGPLRGYLEQDLGLPVNAVTDEAGDLVPGSFAVADALALHLIGKGGQEPIELRQGEFAFRGGLDPFRLLVTFGAPALAFFTIAAIALFVIQNISLNAELAEVEARRDAIFDEVLGDARVGLTSSDLPKLRDAIDSTQRRASALSADDVPPTIELIDTLGNAFPPASELEVNVLTLTVNPKNLTFDAEVSGYAESTAVFDSVKAHERFQGATKGNEKQVRDKLQVTIQVPLDGGES